MDDFTFKCHSFLNLRIVQAHLLRNFQILSIQQVFPERIGCLSVESKRILEYQEPQVEIVKNCTYEAWSLGLKVFAVRNGKECLGDKHLPPMLPRLNSSKGCQGGRGGRHVSDVYRLTSKKILQQLYIKFFSY